jgi:hypothetical protein
MGATSIATLFGVSATNTDLSAQILAVAGGTAGLISRYDYSTGNYYWAGLVSHGTYYTAEIHKVFGGKSYNLTTPVLVGNTLGTLRFETVGTSLRLFQNGKLVTFTNDTSLRQGSVGLGGSRGSGFASITASAVVLSTPNLSLTFTDSFTATSDGQLSNAWLATQGNFSTAGSMLTGQAAANLAVLNGVVQKSVSLQTVVAGLPATTGSMAGLVASYNLGTGNMYWAGLKYHDGAYYAEIWKRLSGVWYRLSSQKIGNSAAHTLQFNVSTSGGQQLYVDGVLISTTHDGTLAVGGTVGLYATGKSVVTSFRAGTI